MFEDGKAPQVGQLEISVEGGLIQKLSRRVVADASVGGCKLLDATLSEDAATGLLVNQTYALIAEQCILLSAQAAAQRPFAGMSNVTPGFTSRLMPSGDSVHPPT